MSTQNPPDDKTLVGHLAELRNRLVIIFAVNIAAALVSFQYMDRVINYFLLLNPGMQLVYISPSEQFGVNINIALLCGVVLCSPITIGQIWFFVAKGLTDRERRVSMVALFCGMLFFVMGAVFCYLVVLPFTLRYFLTMAIEGIPAMVSIKEYVSFINTMLLCFGAVFEMPVLVFALTWLGVVKPEFLVSSRGTLIVLIFIIAAIATPPDIVSQLMLGLPMVVLLEFSIFVCKFVYRVRGEKEKTD